MAVSAKLQRGCYRPGGDVVVRAGQLEEGGVGNQRMCSARHPNVAQRALLNQALLIY